MSIKYSSIKSQNNNTKVYETVSIKTNPTDTIIDVTGNKYKNYNDSENRNNESSQYHLSLDNIDFYIVKQAVINDNPAMKTRSDEAIIKYAQDIINELNKELQKIFNENGVEYNESNIKCIYPKGFENTLIENNLDGYKLIDHINGLFTLIKVNTDNIENLSSINNINLKYTIAKELCEAGDDPRNYIESMKKYNPQPGLLSKEIFGDINYPLTETPSEEEINKLKDYFRNKIKQLKNEGKNDEEIKIEIYAMYIAFTEEATCEEITLLSNALGYVDKKFDFEILNLMIKNCDNDDQRRSVLGNASKDSKNLSKESFDYIISQFKEGGLLYNILTEEEKTKFLNIQQKYNNGDNLSDEDIAFYEKCNQKLETAQATAENMAKGGSQRDDLSENEYENDLRTINNGVISYGEKYYREYLANLHTWYEENKENLNLPENFEELMNAATNGNYSTVVSDIKNGTTTPLDMTPVSSESSSAAETSAYNSQTGSFSTLSQETIQASQNKLAELYNKNFFNNNKEDDELGKSVKNTSALTIANPTKITSQKGLKEFFSNTSNAFGKIISGKVEVIGTNAEKAVVDIYDRMDKALKGTYLAFASNEWFGKFLNITDASVIAAYMDKGGLGNSCYRTEQMEKKVEEAKG